jgi:dipeptidase E
MKLYFIGGGRIEDGELESIDRRIISETDKKNILIFPWSSDDQNKLEKFANILPAYFKKLGMREVTFASLDDSAQVLEQKISRSSVIYLPGGKTEYFLERAKEKNLSGMLKSYSKIIAGNSAGALIMCKDAVMTMDKDTPKTKVVNGLGLVDFSVEVHYEESNDAELLELSKDRRIFAIPERCAVVWDNGKLEFLGDITLFYNSKKQKARKIKGVFFDVGGVLVKNNHGDALKWMLKTLGIESSDTAVLEEFKKGFMRAKSGEYMKITDIIQSAIDAVKNDVDAKEMYLRYIRENMSIRPGTKEMLESLKKRVRIGIITNTDNALNDATLSKFGIENIFDVVMTAEMAKAYKTNSVIFKIACDKMGFKTNEVLWVGDSMDDNAKAKSVGMNTALLGVDGDSDYKLQVLDDIFNIL